MEAEEAVREMERREKQAFAEAMQAKEQTSKFLKQTMQEYVVLKNSNIQAIHCAVYGAYLPYYAILSDHSGIFFFALWEWC